MYTNVIYVDINRASTMYTKYHISTSKITIIISFNKAILKLG